MLALFPARIGQALPAATPTQQLNKPNVQRRVFRRTAIWRRLFSVNLWGFNAADAGGYAALTDSSKSVPTESYTCCTLSSVYCLLSFSEHAYAHAA